MMAPSPPADYVPRPDEFAALKAALLDPRGEPVAITSALKGAGGYGKTTLAKALCADNAIQDAYHDGMLWVTLGENPGEPQGRIEDLITISMRRSASSSSSLDAAASRLAKPAGRPEADGDQVLDPPERVARAFAQRHPEHAVMVGVLDVGIGAEGAGEGGLAVAARTLEGGGDADRVLGRGSSRAAFSFANSARARHEVGRRRLGHHRHAADLRRLFQLATSRVQRSGTVRSTMSARRIQPASRSSCSAPGGPSQTGTT